MPTHSHASAIHVDAWQAASLTTSTKQVLDLRILDLNEVVTNVTRMLARVLGEDIELKTLLAPFTPASLGRKVRQVLDGGSKS